MAVRGPTYCLRCANRGRARIAICGVEGRGRDRVYQEVSCGDHLEAVMRKCIAETGIAHVTSLTPDEDASHGIQDTLF